MNKLILLVGVLAACGDDGGGGTECGNGTELVDGECVSVVACGDGTVLTGGVCLPDVAARKFTQIEQLARPGINEALLLSDGFNNGYNATAPTFTGVPTDVLNQVVAEAKTVLKAIHLGSCLVQGALGLTEGANGSNVGTALVKCGKVGGGVFVGGDPITGTVVAPEALASATAYADKVFAQFIPDVMRIDTAVPSGYLTLCGDPTQPSILLCGGRLLDDDVIDVTYNYLITSLSGTPGAQTTANAFNDQVRALSSDGVAYDAGSTAGNGGNKNGLTNGVGNNNGQQGHPAILAAFPYSAAPF